MRDDRGAAAGNGETGTVTVEVAALLPVVAVCMLLVAQVALMVSERLAIQHAAREGARAAAVGRDDAAVRAAALRAGSLDGTRAVVTVTPQERAVGDPVRVEVRYRPAVMPVVERFVPAAELRAWTEMRAERATP